ncbi:MAG TPA: nuclear transport factor 2 family protein [Candidatus Limnocylindria bacterium]
MPGLDRDYLRDWLDRYVAAWRANEPEPIRALFTDDVRYRYQPYGDSATVRGLDALVDNWLENPDPPDSWEAEYRPYAVDGDNAVATGWSRYLAADSKPERTFRNVFLMRFAPDGRCAEFTDVYMLEE